MVQLNVIDPSVRKVACINCDNYAGRKHVFKFTYKTDACRVAEIIPSPIKGQLFYYSDARSLNQDNNCKFFSLKGTPLSNAPILMPVKPWWKIWD